jgi:hypothetical protein
MTRSRDVADTQDNLGGAVAPYVAGKNAVINGGMDVWQRGTSLTASGSQFIADRWNFFRDGYATGITVSRQTTNDTTNLPNIQYCQRVQRDSGNTSTAGIQTTQNLETVNSTLCAGKTVTISFYARKGANFSSTSSHMVVGVYSGTGTDQALRNGFTNSALVISQNNTLTTTWQRFSYTGTVASTATQLGVNFYYAPTGTAGANDWFEITGVQLELGAQATPFARAGGSIGGELALCQRYYIRKNADASSTFATFGTAIATSTTNHWWQVVLPVPMRVTPTSLDYSTTRIQNINNGYPETGGLTLSTSNSNNQIATGSGSVASGLTSGNFYWLGANNSASSYIGFSAEL